MGEGKGRGSVFGSLPPWRKAERRWKKKNHPTRAVFGSGAVLPLKVADAKYTAGRHRDKGRKPAEARTGDRQLARTICQCMGYM